MEEKIKELLQAGRREEAIAMLEEYLQFRPKDEKDRKSVV